jgi:hypothetical protein
MLPCAVYIHFELNISKQLKYIFGASLYIACLPEKTVLNKNYMYRVTQLHSWLRHCATSQKVTGSILVEVIGNFH